MDVYDPTCRVEAKAGDRQFDTSLSETVRPESQGPADWTGVSRHVVNVPDTSLSLVEAWLPVIVVSSMTTVPPGSRSSPPPMPTPEGPVVPAVPGMAVPGKPPGVPPDPACAPPPSPAGAAQPPIGLVAGDGISGLGLLGTLLRAQSGLDGEGAGRLVEDAATQTRTAGAAVAAIAAFAGRAGTAEPAVAAAAALAEAATSAHAAGAAGGLVIGEVHGDTGKGRGAAIVQPAADSSAGPATVAAIRRPRRSRRRHRDQSGLSGRRWPRIPEAP